MTIAIAMRDVALGDRTDCAEGSDHDRRSSEAVSIKIANDEDRFPLGAGGLEPRDEACRIGEKVRIMQGAIVSIQKLSRPLWVSDPTTQEKRCQRKVQVLRNRQIGQELQDLGVGLEFAFGGRVQRCDRL